MNISREKLSFSTKGKTLEDLSRALTTAKILPFLRFSVGAFKEDSNSIVRKIIKTFNSDELIVRSSAKSEDSFAQSRAGYFKSVSNVPCSSASKIKSAIVAVIKSYDDDDKNNEVLVQPMLSQK